MVITFFDALAGIGGFRLALTNIGWKCVGWCEIDKRARETYYRNYKPWGEPNFHDITKLNSKDVPQHDVLCAGFPCQPFSHASCFAKKRHGFEEARGTIFFYLAKILRDKQPKAFFFENVKGLGTHNKGDTLNLMLMVLGNKINGQARLSQYVDCLNYDVHVKTLNSKFFGVPQNRERIYIIGFKRASQFQFPIGHNNVPCFSSIKEDGDLDDYVMPKTPSRLDMANKCHKVLDNGVLMTLTTKQDRFPNAGLVPYKGWFRFLTPRECARAQGFPDSFKLPSNKNIAYKQLGNAVTINVVKAIGEKMGECLQ